MRTNRRRTCSLFIAAFTIIGCSGGSSSGSSSSAGSGGLSNTGGNASLVGGSSSAAAGNGSGGDTQALGGTGASTSTTAAQVSTGGSNSTGGASATGGAQPGTGGQNPTGGTKSVGGGNTGGASATGGSRVSGGAPAGGAATGGSKASGGTTAPGGSTATGGTTTSSSGGSSGPAGVRWIGRVDASNSTSVKFAWSGTGFVANVQGTKISVKLQSESSAAFFQPVIDGTVGQRFQVAAGSAQTVVLGNNLSAGTHKVELYRETEGSGYGDTVFQGFVDGTLLSAPAEPGRLIEVVGDSISAGYGNLGTNPCGFTLDTESAYQAYGWQLGRFLNADVSVIACSGWGMYRDYGGSTANVLSKVYGNTLGTLSNSPAWGFTPKPDAVVINLGTNDSSSSDPGTAYETAYVAFLKTVRSHYPNAWIFLTIGPMTGDPMLTTMRNHIANVITTFADSKVTQVNVNVQDTTKGVGCDWHPTVAADTVVANALKTQIAAKLGW